MACFRHSEEAERTPSGGPADAHSAVAQLGAQKRATEGVKTVCSMAFTPTSYMTISDGMIWILGTPLFYEHLGKSR